MLKGLEVLMAGCSGDTPTRCDMGLHGPRTLRSFAQKIAKQDVTWIDLYYSPHRNVSWKNIKSFYQSPLGRFFLEDTTKD